MATQDDDQQQAEGARGTLDELTSGLKERVPDVLSDAGAAEAAGAALIAAGLGTIVVAAVRRRVLLGGLGGGLIVAGLACFGGSAYSRRSAHIEEAEEVVREQLADLDPIARAQVLKDMAVEQANALKNRGAAE